MFTRFISAILVWAVIVAPLTPTIVSAQSQQPARQRPREATPKTGTLSTLPDGEYRLKKVKGDAVSGITGGQFVKKGNIVEGGFTNIAASIPPLPSSFCICFRGETTGNIVNNPLVFQLKIPGINDGPSGIDAIMAQVMGKTQDLAITHYDRPESIDFSNFAFEPINSKQDPASPIGTCGGWNYFYGSLYDVAEAGNLLADEIVDSAQRRLSQLGRGNEAFRGPRAVLWQKLYSITESREEYNAYIGELLDSLDEKVREKRISLSQGVETARRYSNALLKASEIFSTRNMPESVATEKLRAIENTLAIAGLVAAAALFAASELAVVVLFEAEAAGIVAGQMARAGAGEIVAVETGIIRGLGGRVLTTAERSEFESFAMRARSAKLVENPSRTGSWGRVENGKFKEITRIDVADAGKQGWRGRTHIHIEGEPAHLNPATKLPGEP